jgi:hypothetical protein
VAFKSSPEFELWAAACEPAWERLNATHGQAEEHRVFHSLPPQEQWLVALFVVDAQIVNGGFSQLYCNEMGWMAPAAAVGLHAIGLNEAAEMVELAHRTFQPEVDANDGAITDALSELCDRLSPRYYKIADRLDNFVAAYLRAGPSTS